MYYSMRLLLAWSADLARVEEGIDKPLDRRWVDVEGERGEDEGRRDASPGPELADDNIYESRQLVESEGYIRAVVEVAVAVARRRRGLVEIEGEEGAVWWGRREFFIGQVSFALLLSLRA